LINVERSKSTFAISPLALNAWCRRWACRTANVKLPELGDNPVHKMITSGLATALNNKNSFPDVEFKVEGKSIFAQAHINYYQTLHPSKLLLTVGNNLSFLGPIS